MNSPNLIDLQERFHLSLNTQRMERGDYTRIPQNVDRGILWVESWIAKLCWIKEIVSQRKTPSKQWFGVIIADTSFTLGLKHLSGKSDMTP